MYKKAINYLGDIDILADKLIEENECKRCTITNLSTRLTNKHAPTSSPTSITQDYIEAELSSDSIRSNDT